MRHWLRAIHDLGPRPAPRDPRAHLDAAIDWLARAQDATQSGGVSRSYALRYMRGHRRRGWLAAYPETTGYIIPTFLEYARRFGRPEIRDRALRMADWESDVQMESGAVQGGTIAFPPTPAIFNTGQVLQGWARAHAAEGSPRHLESMRRAADFLVSSLDGDGAWRRHGSRYARPGVNTYDARTALGLAEASLRTGDSRHRDAAARALRFALTQQRENGWFQNCCLDDDRRPLLHTLAYTMEGLLEGGAILADERMIEGARRAADAVLERQRGDGWLPGRFDEGWRAAAGWSCLTGDAQTAYVWTRLFELTGKRHYIEAARRTNRFLAGTQDLEAADPGIRGGIQGSFPIWGEYGPFEYLNWAAKFYADSLLCELRADAAASARA
jgi:hypothetical protein